MSPFVGLPSADLSGRCGYSADLDKAFCDATATVHLMVQDDAWGTVSLAACDAHVAIAEASAAVLDRHPFGAACSAPEPMFLPDRCEVRP